MATRTPEQIRADIQQARQGLSANIEGLVSEVHPVAIKDRTIAEAKTFVADTANDAKTFVADTAADAKATVVDDLGVRWDNIGTALIVVAVGIATIAVLRGFVGLFRRG